MVRFLSFGSAVVRCGGSSAAARRTSPSGHYRAFRSSPTSQANGATALGGMFCVVDGVSVEGDPFACEEFDVDLIRGHQGDSDFKGAGTSVSL